MSTPRLARTLLRTTPTLAPISNRTILSVTGSQASEFLNGILATSVSDRPCYSAFLHAQGRVLYDVFLYTQPAPAGQARFLIEHDAQASDATPLLTLLKRYVLRSKVRIRDVTQEHDIWAMWGSENAEAEMAERQWSWARSGAVEPVWDSGEKQWPWGLEHGVVLDRRAPGMGKRMLVPQGQRPKEASTHDISYPDTYLLHRILHGVPEGSTDIQPMHAFPMESNLDAMGGLDFRKGCYVGQELTVRTYHTGAVRKRILPIVIEAKNNSGEQGTAPPILMPHLPIRASLLQHQNSSGGTERTPRPRGTGTLLSNIIAPGHDAGIGLALLRLEQVEGVQRGDIELSVEDQATDETAEDKTTWVVQHWWPDWWPKQEEVI